MLLGTCMSSWETCLFRSLASFKMGSFVFWLGCKSSIYILDARLFIRSDAHHLECRQREMPEHFLPISSMVKLQCHKHVKIKLGRAWVYS